jgi:MFS transporter, DHA1 family, tetracycline resistance protein
MRFIMVTVLLDMIAIGIIVPVLPALVGQFVTSPAEQTKWYAWLVFIFSAASFFATPLLGALSDRYGRRPILLLGFAGLAINFFITAFATSLWMLVLSRIIGGGMQANAAVANAYVADITPPEKRAKRFGLLGAMFGVGFILGPMVGGLLGGIDLQLPFVAAGVLACLNLIYGYFVLPESLNRTLRRPVTWSSANPFTSIKRLAQLKGVGMLVAVIAFSGVAQFILYTTWVLYTTYKFGWSTVENGWSLFAVGLMSVIVQGWLLGKLLKRFKPHRLALMALISSTLAYALYGLVPHGWMLFVVVGCNLFGYTLQATLQSLVSQAADAATQGQTLGALSGLNSLMSVIAPSIGGPLLVLVADFPRGDWRLGLPMYVCALLQAVALVFAWRHFRLRPVVTGGPANVAAGTAQP